MKILIFSYDLYVMEGSGLALHTIADFLEYCGETVVKTTVLPTVTEFKTFQYDVILTQQWAAGPASELAFQMDVPMVMMIYGSGQYSQIINSKHDIRCDHLIFLTEQIYENFTDNLSNITYTIVWPAELYQTENPFNSLKKIRNALLYVAETGFSNIEIITCAKVGSRDFLDSCKNKYSTSHGHSLQKLREILSNSRNTLIIVGIRNPIDRNLSYLFQTYPDDIYNDVKTRANNYEGEYCYIPEIPNWVNGDVHFSADKLIELYFNMPYHNTFNDWFEEFFEITGLSEKKFNREKGLEFYQFPHNNVIMIYTLEKLNSNRAEICKFLDIQDLYYSNNSDFRGYNKLYNEVKKKITYTQDYLNRLLDTDIMKFFYTSEDIDKMYSKYRVKTASITNQPHNDTSPKLDTLMLDQDIVNNYSS